MAAPELLARSLFCRLRIIVACSSIRKACAAEQTHTAAASVAEAREIGYAVMRLDTASRLAAARLYESLGFVRREACYETPVGETIFMERRL